MFTFEIYHTATECFALLCASKLHCNEYWITWSRGVISIVSNLCKFLTPVMNQSDCKCLFRYSISIFLFHSYCNYSHRANCYLFRAACGQQRPASCNWMCSACNINTIQPSSCDWYVHTQTLCWLPVYCACSCSYDWTVSLHCSSSTHKHSKISLCKTVVNMFWEPTCVNLKMFLLPYNHCIFSCKVVHFSSKSSQVSNTTYKTLI